MDKSSESLLVTRLLAIEAELRKTAETGKANLDDYYIGYGHGAQYAADEIKNALDAAAPSELATQCAELTRQWHELAEYTGDMVGRVYGECSGMLAALPDVAAALKGEVE